MNLNNWLKDDIVEKIELTIIGKKISKGRGIDYYIIFDSDYGRLNNRIQKRKYESFLIGEKYTASVKKSFFEGYFLAEPMSAINDP